MILAEESCPETLIQKLIQLTAIGLQTQCLAMTPADATFVNLPAQRKTLMENHLRNLQKIARLQSAELVSVRLHLDFIMSASFQTELETFFSWYPQMLFSNLLAMSSLRIRIKTTTLKMIQSNC